MKSFDFLERELLCCNGLKFFLGDGSQDLRPVIEADRPLLLDGFPIIREESRQSSFVTSFELLETMSSELLVLTRLPNYLVVRICFSDGSVEEESFRHLYSGCTRDAFEAHRNAWVLKIEVPSLTPKPRNNTKDEWDIYNKFGSLNQILPKCYGYAELEHGGLNLHCILMERIAFTFESFYKRVRLLEMIQTRMSIILFMILRTVSKMYLVSGEGYHTTDWHTGNIAFNYVGHSEEDVDMRLIDFSGHEKKPFESPRDRMKSGMKALLLSLPGPHIWSTDDMSHFSQEKQDNALKLKIS